MRVFILIVALAAAAVASDIIDGEFMVQFHDGMIASKAQEEAFSTLMKSDFGVDVQKYYHFGEVAMMLVKADKVNMARVEALPEVAIVEPNMMFYASQTCNVDAHAGVWGLDRTDQRLTLTTTPAQATYDHGASTGAGVDSYVIDTGIRITHNSFGGRAIWGWNADGLEDFDDNGHGTHCAGTIGSNDYGLAKGVTLIAVKVLGRLGGGSTGDIVAGCEWVSTRHGTSGRNSNANMSLGGGANTILDNAVQGMINAGVTVAVAAGNSDADACNSSPSRLADAITVGATQSDDQSATFTNWGTCLDVFAPGVNILSTWNGNDDDTSTISGTSMACPHVCGVVSRYQSSGSPSPAQVATWITGNATPNEVDFRLGHGTSPNLMLYGPCTLP